METAVYELSDFWQQQAEIMGYQPSLQAPETAVSAVSEPLAAAGWEEELQAKREKLAEIEAWLIRQPISHPRWAEGAEAYQQLQEEIQAAEDGAFHYLRQPGDNYQGVVIFPSDTAIPQIAGKWKRLPDGSVEARVSLFELRVMREMAIISGVIER